jgi:hypothetical protein
MLTQSLRARMQSAAQVLAVLVLSAIAALAFDCRLAIFECPGATGTAAIRS